MPASFKSFPSYRLRWLCAHTHCPLFHQAFLLLYASCNMLPQLGSQTLCSTSSKHAMSPRISNAPELRHRTVFPAQILVLLFTSVPLDDLTVCQHFIFAQPAVTQMQQIPDRFVCVGWCSGCCVAQCCESCTKLLLLNFFKSRSGTQLQGSPFLHLRASAHFLACLRRHIAYCWGLFHTGNPPTMPPLLRHSRQCPVLRTLVSRLGKEFS